MGFFSKLFSGKNQSPDSVTVETTRTWHYAGEGDCPPSRSMSAVSIPGIAPQDAFGFFNLGVYRITGHIINEQTGRQNKKVVKVNALSKIDAEKLALDLLVMPPLTIEVVDSLNEPPNEYQISNAKEYGIVIPPGAVDSDVRTMVKRGSDRSPSPELALFCTQLHFLFSRFIGERDLINMIFPSLPERDQIALFACAVDCAQLGVQIGDPRGNPKYYAFADSAPRNIIDAVLLRGVGDLPVPRKGTKAWQAVVSYLG